MSSQSAKLNQLRFGTRLCKAASMGNEDRLLQLLKKIDVNTSDYDGRTALHLAVASNQEKSVNLLLSKGANVNAVDRWGGTPLDDAIRQNNTTLQELLITKGAKKSNQTFPEVIGKFLQAAYDGDAKQIQTLLDSNPELAKAQDYDKRTALHVAAGAGHYNIVKILVSAGAYVNAIDRWGATPMKEAHKNHLQQISNFLEIEDGNLGAIEADPHLPMVLSVFARVLELGNCPEEVKKDMIFTVDSIIEKYGTQVNELIKELPETQTNSLKSHLLNKYQSGTHNQVNKFEDWVSNVIELQSKLESHVLD